MFTPEREKSRMQSPSSRKRISMSPFSSGSASRPARSQSRLLGQHGSGIYENSMIAGRSQVPSVAIEEASTHRVLSYGQTLPVQVSEMLTSRDPGPISCKLGQNGWAWLVKGNRLLIWKYIPTSLSKIITCCELHLCATELYHKADLISVISIPASDSQQSSKESSASVITVSPEGMIRLWPDFANPGIFIEASAGLKGKEFSTLASLPPHGCVVMTTDNDTLLITPNQSGIVCQVMSDSSGLLSGIGRRMSSFWHGSNAPCPSIHPPKLSVVPADNSSVERSLFVLANGSLQKWEIGSGKEKLLCQVDLVEKLREEVLSVIEIEGGSLEKVMPLDIKSTGYCLAVLCCAVVKTDTLKAILLLGTKQSSSGDFSAGFESFVPLEYSFDIEDEKRIPEVELLIPAGSYQAFIYNKDFITANPVSEMREGLVEVTFPSEMAKLVGGGSFGNDSVFLSKRHGLFTVIPSHRDSAASVLRPETSKTSNFETSLTEPTEDQSGIPENLNTAEISGNANVKDVIVKAFLEHSGGNTFEATEIVLGLSLDSKINEAVVSVGQEIVDSIPMSDPRWAQHTAPGMKSASDSVLIMAQLADKERVFGFFLRFLEDADIFDKLTVCEEENIEYYTKFKLCEHAEKLHAAKALQTINLSEDKVMQRAIELVIDLRGEARPGNHLTDQDVFFREVSRVEDLFPVLSDYQQQSLDRLKSTTDQIEIISATNSIIIAALKSAWMYRQSKASFYQPIMDNHEKIVEYIPWTGAVGVHGIRTLLRKQIDLTHEKALPFIDTTSAAASLLQQAVDLADLLLDGYHTQLQFLRNSSEALKVLQMEFENERKAVIQPLIEEEHYRMALALAEKYEDFSLMILICERENNSQKLEKYKIAFAEKGFLDVLFQWYMDRGEWSKLLSQTSSSKLEAFLETQNHLRWLHYVGIGDYINAANALKELAESETKCLARKKTMLSIAKLCLLSSTQENTSASMYLEGIQNQLEIILHQETLPAVVIENLGYDPNNMPPFSVEDIIQFYTGMENPDANEYDFKRALDLIPFVEPTMKKCLWNQTWERAILKDDWTKAVATDPLNSISETVFYKCAKLFSTEAPDIKSVLPRIEALQASETLQQHKLSSNDNFLFLIKAFYESLSAR